MKNRRESRRKQPLRALVRLVLLLLLVNGTWEDENRQRSDVLAHDVRMAKIVLWCFWRAVCGWREVREEKEGGALLWVWWLQE